MATAEMVKVDLFGQDRALYRPPDEPVLVTVPAFAFLMIDGVGDPEGSEAFRGAVQALYGLAYPLKFALRGQTGLDYGVMPLEGLWFGEAADFATTDRSAWRWTLMIRQPPETIGMLFHTGVFHDVLASARTKKPDVPYARVRMEMLDEGECVQLMHRGPYREEPASIARLHAFIGRLGRTPRGPHHEIYLGDPRRCAPQSLRTVLRQGVSAAA